MEKERQSLQIKLDAQKTQLERNKLGQFSTPINLANEILSHGISLLTDKSISFLDPAIGTGAFYSALIQNSIGNRLEKALGFDIDPFYAKPSKELWRNTDLEIRIADFTTQNVTSKFNLIICNPPYVRHHYINNEDKNRLQQDSLKETEISLSGLAGLYSYFMLMSHKWMSDNAIAGWLIPSEFMDVNYGVALKKYLLKKVTLLQIHRFNPSDVQFSDAYVSSAIVWFKNCPPNGNQTTLFTYGGTLSNPRISKSIELSSLEKEYKWSRFPISEERIITDTPVLSEFFDIKRGLATGGNDFFILPESEIIARNLPQEFFRPILPGPRYLKDNIISSDLNGMPITDRKLFLLDTSVPEYDIEKISPELFSYLEEGKRLNIDKGYICSHRTPWYSQEKRNEAPIVCTYMGRILTPGKHPFRFILNKSNATMTNVYLGMYPKKQLLRILENEPDLLIRICRLLNEISIDEILSEGRVYGGGLHKLEPKELAKVSMPFLEILSHTKAPKQIEMGFSAIAAE